MKTPTPTLTALMPSVLVMTACAAVLGVVASLTSGLPGLLACALSAVVVLLTFTTGVLVVDRVVQVWPEASLPVALLTYATQVGVLMVFLVAVGSGNVLAGDVDVRWLGGSVAVLTAVLAAGFARGLMRARIPAFDVDLAHVSDTSAGTPTGSREVAAR